MRTIITRIAYILLLVTGIKSIGSAQNVYTDADLYPKWRLGLNAGGTWQTNDVKKNYAGLAGGFNIERILNKKEDAPIGFSLGFRYLSGNSSGYDNNKNFGLKSNYALNGKNDSLVKYDSIPGYFYNNYYTHLAEGNLELKINFPAMEKRSKMIFHVFGGLGFNKYKTRIDALDKDGKMYDYSKLSSNPSVGNMKSFYGTNFETLADRDDAQGTLIFTPSLGVGLGFRLSKHVAFVFEHKVSFPFTNTLDGVQYTNTNTKLQGNDIYHYTSANLIFTIWGKHNSTNYNSNTNTNTNVNTNNNTNVVTNNGNNQPKPVINVYSPSTNPSTSYTNVQQVSGTIQYVNSANNVSINVNGNQVTNYTFNPNNGSFSFGANLLGGANTVNITATNTAGQDNESITINHTPQNITNPVVGNELPPNVQITYPSNNYSTTSSSVNVNATITNVTNTSNIAISANGYTISNFNFNSYNGSVSFVAPLVQGSNSIIVSAFNNEGNDAEQVFVTCTGQNTTNTIIPTGLKPVVSFNNPSTSPFQSTTNTFSVTARVTNVTAERDVTVQYNGLPISNFTLNQYGFVNFAVTLNEGSNTVAVTGTNTSGSDTKMATINFKAAGFPPVVTLINPAVSPTTLMTSNTNVIAKVKNVENQSNISVTVNNLQSPFTFNTSDQTLTIPVSLNLGSNVVSISATTAFGNDTKTTVIERKESALKKPIVTVISPAATPFITNTPVVPVVAQVLNAGLKQISVLNGSNVGVPFSFDEATQQISFTPTLLIGANTFTIKATNQAGSDSKSITIDYKKNAVLASKPEVAIVNPGASPYVTTDAQLNLKASTINVNSQQEVSVLLNGVVSNFTFNTSNKEVEVPLNLSIGTNTVTVSVSNVGGSDSKTQIIDRIKQPKLVPVVTLVNPQSSPFASATSTYTVSAEILNVINASEVSVMQGQTPVTFNYDNSTRLVSFVANIAGGSSTYIIKGTNQTGSDSKTITLTYIKRVVGDTITSGLKKPLVTITTPASVNTTSTNNSEAINASVTNVTSASQVNVLVNGVVKTDFAYSNGAVSFSAALNVGNNTITITGTNAIGTDSKTVSILRKKAGEEAGSANVQKPVVTFVSPGSLNSTVTSVTQNINATVTNVSGASQVNVKVNGTDLNGFTYANGTVTFEASLNLGNNIVTITGTNAVGNDSKTISILRNRAAVETGIANVQKPVVTFVIPNSPSSTVTSVIQNINATVTNVSGASQVNVKVNGTDLSGFTYVNGTVTFETPLNLGNNTVTITGTNAIGNDTKTISITRNRAAVETGITNLQKPVVTFVTPNTSGTIVTSEVQSITATVTNVTGASEVSVKVNESPLSNFSYSNGTITFDALLNLGENVVTVTGTNAVGTDSKTISITQKKNATESGTATMEKPVVTFSVPYAPTSNTYNTTENITASVTNVLGASQINVNVNGSAVSNFNYSGGSVTFNANLNVGDNTISISATNVGGSDSKSVIIKRRPMANPKVTIDIPASSPAIVNSKNITINATVRFVASSSEITVISESGSIIPFSYVANTFQLTVETTMPMNQTTYTISATNSTGSDSKSVTFNYVAPAIPEQMVICHHADNGSLETITIPVSEWPMHQEHGDTQGKCVANGNNGNNGNGNGNNTNNNDPMITICHYPPGNANNPQQIQIAASAWPAHQAHGDVIGACPVSNGNNNNGNGGKTNNGNNNDGGKTNTTTPIINTPRTINNNQVTPKKEETVTPPKQVETVPVTPKKVETTSTPKIITPVTEPKKNEENNGTPAPRTIKPR